MSGARMVAGRIRIKKIQVAVEAGGLGAVILTQAGHRIVVPPKPAAAQLREDLLYLADKLHFPASHVPSKKDLEALL